MKRVLVSLVALVACALAAPLSQAQDVAKKPVRLLFCTQSGGFKHPVVTRKSESELSFAERELTQLGISSGVFRVDCTQDIARDFTKENLQNYDIVSFYMTGELDTLPFPEGALDYFLNDWLKQKGHGFLGIHTATDMLRQYPPYMEMIGAAFTEHPWRKDGTVTITVHDKEHPLSKPWGDEFTLTEEIYQFNQWQPDKVRVLMSLDMAKTALKKPYHVPVAWVREWGQGKVVYISLGHNEAVWTNPTYQASLLGGIKWLLGYEKGDATPNPELSQAQEVKAKADAAAAPSEPAASK